MTKKQKRQKQQKMDFREAQILDARVSLASALGSLWQANTLDKRIFWVRSVVGWHTILSSLEQLQWGAN